MTSWLLAHQQLLSEQINSNKLPHALLFIGAQSAGKKALAQWLSQLIACQQPVYDANTKVSSACQHCKNCQLYLSNTYPDHKVVEAEASSISVEDIRASNHFFEKTAQIGVFKSAVITPANKMTVSAANALLKTLEEPTANSVIILLTDDVETLLPTIISRCRLYTLRPPIGQKLLHELGESGEHQFANLTQLPELSDGEIAAQFEAFQQSFMDYLLTGQGRQNLLTLFTSNQYALRWIEKIITNLIRQQAGWVSKENKLYSEGLITHNKQVLWNINEQYQQCSRKIKTIAQTNVQFEFEKFLNDIAKIANTH